MSRQRGRLVTLIMIIIEPADGNQVDPVLEGINSIVSFRNNKLCNKEQTWTSSGNDGLYFRTFFRNNNMSSDVWMDDGGFITTFLLFLIGLMSVSKC